jgi:hypothetical protein
MVIISRWGLGDILRSSQVSEVELSRRRVIERMLNISMRAA